MYKGTGINPRYRLEASGEFVIENYNFSKPFASFFPGIAGLYGIPMWVFYVNRGQGIISAGVEDKDHSILEFLPANKAWQLVCLQGFRTFLKIKNNNNFIFYEPFCLSRPNNLRKASQKMRINSFDLCFEEDNPTLGLSVKVKYFTLPDEPVAGLVRILTIRNNSRRVKVLEIADGLSRIIPYGTNDFFLKNLSRTIEAWMKVYFLKSGIPYFKLDTEPADKPQVSFIRGSNFYISFCGSGTGARILPFIVDAECLFGKVNNFLYPEAFLHRRNFKVSRSQITESRTPCAFSFLSTSLKPYEEKTIYSIIGYAQSQEVLGGFASSALGRDYLKKKEARNKEIINRIENNIFTVSARREFNFYCRQTYLDNVIRGGLPLSLETQKGRVVFHVYSRKHGDTERDYNKYLISPTCFSQGNGNYRDTNQNRRCDNFFNTDTADSNIIDFFNLIQADGFNPLVIGQMKFIFSTDSDLNVLLKDILDKDAIRRLSEFLRRPFSPGSLLAFIQNNHLGLKSAKGHLLKVLLRHSRKVETATHSEGFWIDHWSYNLDLLENYLAVYPEKVTEILLKKNIFTFFDNEYVVNKRAHRYFLKDGRLTQMHSVVKDPRKVKLINSRQKEQHKVRKNFGRGQIYYTNLLAKLLCIIVNKFASLDAAGRGIEMEADKPDWYDALNGLPALFGSSTNETFELKRVIEFLQEKLRGRYGRFKLAKEIFDFLFSLNSLTQDYFKAKPPRRDYIFWNRANSLKEDYREKTKFGFSGQEVELRLQTVLDILANFKKKLDSAIARSYNPKKGIYYTYFINEPVKYKFIEGGSVKVTEFKQRPLNFFLESQVHSLRVQKNRQKARALYKAVRRSDLYDRELRMFKVCAPLCKEMPQIGRCRVFSRGWLENESIWLHMEYKFLLELIKNGLYEEYYREFFNCLIAFQKPRIYGRSPLENCSFLASSAFMDKRLWGNGFVARLTGATAEFINMWLIMNIGKEPFRLNKQGELLLEFKPILHRDLFLRHKNKADYFDATGKRITTEFPAGSYAFLFLGKTMIIYHNPKLRNTFGRGAVSAKEIVFMDGRQRININSGSIGPPYAAKVREGEISRIDIFLK
jgi:hypothetical protein